MWNHLSSKRPSWKYCKNGNITNNSGISIPFYAVLAMKILGRANSYKIGSHKCNLCIKEKIFILNANKEKIVNNIDLTIKCRHKFKFRLKNFKQPEN